MSLCKKPRQARSGWPLLPELWGKEILRHLDPIDVDVFALTSHEMARLVRIERGTKPVPLRDKWRRIAGRGLMRLLSWVRALGVPWDEQACAYAAGNGHLGVLEWLRAKDAPWDASACAYAAGNGHLKVLEWLRANGAPWDKRACTYAAKKGHLEVLQWLLANGCPYDKQALISATNGHCEVLQYLRDNNRASKRRSSA